MKILANKLVAATVGALALGATLAATIAPAEAGWRHRGGWGGGRGAAIVGGLALGALAAGAIASSRPAYAYGSECWLERRPVTNRWGDVVGYRRIRVCD